MSEITAEQIARMTDAVMVNHAKADGGVAMRAEVDGLAVYFDLSGREIDDESVYVPENVIAVHPLD
jgi:hypothetical protein